MKSQLLPAAKTAGFGSFCALLSGLVLLGLPARLAAAEDAPKKDPAPAAAKEADKAATPDKDKAKAPEADAGADKEKEKEKAKESPPGAEAAPGEYRNWFETSVGGLIVDGNKAAAQRRLGVPASAYGGIESFHYEHDVGKKGIFKIDGRGIFDNEDYNLRLEWNDPDKGFVKGGISQFREYGDGSAGWFPRNNQWLTPYDDRFELIRGNAFFEGGLRLPGKPELTIRYDHDWREGTKDSTLWGDTSITGGSGVRAIAPTFQNVDEHTHALSVDLRHTIGKTTFGGAFAYERTDLENAWNFWRRPGEASDRHITQKEGVQSDLFSGRAFVDTQFGEKVRLTSAYSYTTLESDLSGSRIVGATYDPVYDPVWGRRDVGFRDLSGTTQLDQHVWSLNLLWNPVPNLAVIPAFRLENQVVDGNSAWTDSGVLDVARNAANAKDMVDLSQQVEVRYTGITNVVLYVRGDWIEGDGNLLETQRLSATQAVEMHRDTDFDRFSQKYTAGANWYPLSRLNFAAQYYRKMNENDYTRDQASYVNVSGLYPSFIQNHGFVTDDVNLRATWRPLDKLTLITRYDLQFNTIDMQGAGLVSHQSAEQTAHIIGETITWTPLTRLYFQPGVNYVIDSTRSAAANQVTFPGSPVEDAHNNYFNVTCTMGVVIDDRTDFQTQYGYYLADNYHDLSLYSQSYGSGAEEHSVTATLIRRISPRLKVSLRYGYFSGHDELAGGFNDYNAHMVYASTQYLF